MLTSSKGDITSETLTSSKGDITSETSISLNPFSKLHIADSFVDPLSNAEVHVRADGSIVIDDTRQTEFELLSHMEVTELYYRPLSNKQKTAVGNKHFNIRPMEMNLRPALRGQPPRLHHGQQPKTEKVQGDGNCFFYSLSRVLTGNDNNHFAIRSRICDYIQANWATIAPFVDANKYKNGAGYVAATKMRLLATWGTWVEIFAFAQLTKFDVTCYTSSGKWARYSAQGSNQLVTKNSFYISNLTGNHFEPVLRSK
jgi:hypothetical protein